VTLPALSCGAAAAGVGFTVSLLVASLAFEGPLLDQAKIGVLATCVLSPLLTRLAIFGLQHLPDELRARQLTRTAEVLTDLDEDVDPERDHIRGPVDAPVTLIEYGDFECPYCGDAAPIITKLLDHFGGDLRYVFRHLPLNDVHPNAQIASEAAEAAAAQGRFWEMHDKLLADPSAVSPRTVRAYAEELGLDVERFADELRRRKHAPRVAEDVRSADASGVTGTPTFFINGRRHQGVYDVDTLTREIKTAVRGAGRQAAAAR
jgi:protein-disulfide isomerase